MTIKEKVVIKGEGHFKGYEHVFEFVDDNRKVDIKTTGALICKIKYWLDFSPKTKNEKLKAYKVKWNDYLKFHLIPDGINPQIDAGQYFVKLNYKLLEPNKLLDYNVALFLLLGLNAWSLGRRIKDFPVLDGDEPAGFFELEFWKTPQNEALRVSAFVVGRKITSENLKTLAEANGFFREAAPANNLKVEKGFITDIEESKDKQERNIPIDKLKILYTALEKDGFITGEFDDLWQWVSHRNQLAYLAKKLKQIRILGDDCHVELAHYIQDPKPESTKPLSYITKQPANTSAIDDVVNQLRG